MTERTAASTRQNLFFLAGLGLCSGASALDYSGYFRLGTGNPSRDASRTCYALPGPGMKYRLGNECDVYGEFAFSQAVQSDGVDYKALIMPKLWNTGANIGTATWDLAQLYFQGKGFAFAPEASLWIGRRFYGRADVHIVDTFYTKMDGTGLGINDVRVGPAKLNVAWFHTDDTIQQIGSRLNVEAHSINVNPGGTLRLTGNLSKGNFDGGTNGWGLGMQHTQANILPEITNTLWLQYAAGSAGIDGNFGNLAAASAAHSWRLVESVNGQRGRWGGQAQVLYQEDRDSLGGKLASRSVGGRVSYALGDNVKLLAEAGYSDRRPDNGEQQRLSKLTIAPAWSMGPGFWNRPEVRLYFTHAKWNAAANAAAGPDGIVGLPGMGNTTRGNSIGLQIESWY